MDDATLAFDALSDDGSEDLRCGDSSVVIFGAPDRHVSRHSCQH